MPILAIETSCDETAVAVVELTSSERISILGDLVSSQVDLHALYGGVVPELAAREHLKNLPLLVEEALRVAGITFDRLSGIGVTQGPGLKGCLMIGLGFAKGLATALHLPLVGVNHIEGHLLSPLINNPKLTFPYLALVVSGGHTELLEVLGLGRYRLLARTHDDAAGETFDKSANLLGFSYPGGARLAALADSVSSSRYRLPAVMRAAEGFSFSGLKTAVSLLIKREGLEPSEKRAELAHAIQEAIVEALVSKTRKALDDSETSRLVVVGGVSANRRLKMALGTLTGAEIYFPEAKHSIDNAAMIGLVAAMRLKRGDRMQPGAQAISRWPVETLQ